MNDIKNGAQSVTNDANYAVQRTAGETNDNLFGFMNNNIWSWIVIGIVALVVIGIIWYYMARKDNYSDHE